MRREGGRVVYKATTFFRSEPAFHINNETIKEGRKKERNLATK